MAQTELSVVVVDDLERGREEGGRRGVEDSFGVCVKMSAGRTTGVRSECTGYTRGVRMNAYGVCIRVRVELTRINKRRNIKKYEEI